MTGDGTLELRIPTKLPETDVGVLLVLQPVGSEDTAPTAIWPEGYFDRTFGSFRDNPLTREPASESKASCTRTGKCDGCSIPPVS